jgi:hypothetical protein
MSELQAPEAPRSPSSRRTVFSPMAPLKPARFHIHEQVSSRYVAVVPEGMSKDEVMHPQFWTHIAPKVRAYDVIDVRAEDGRYWAQLLVVRASLKEVVVRMYNYVDLDPALAQMEDLKIEGMLVAWKGAHDKFVVIRDQDKVIVRTGIDSRSQAIQEAIQYARNIAA